MAARQATRKYPDLATFLSEYHGTLRGGALLLPADALGGEQPAPELKLDLILPLVGRVGPINAQVVARLPDGSTALRLPEIPASVDAAFKRVLDAVDEVRAYLVASGQLVEPGSQAALAQAEAAQEEPLDDEPVEDEILDVPPVEDDPDALIDDEDEDLVEEEAEAAPSRPPGLGAGLSLPDLGIRSASQKGDLKESTLRAQLVALAMSRGSGILRLQTPDGRLRYGYWQQGGPVGWRADPPVQDEYLGSLLVRSGQLTAEQHNKSLALMEARGLRQGEALVAMGIVRADQVPALLSRQAELILGKILAERRGLWAFYELAELPEPFTNPPVPVLSLLFRAYVGHAKKMPSKDLIAAFRKRADQTAQLRAGALTALRDIRYTREEAVVFDALRGRPRPIQELIGGALGAPEAVSAVLWALGEMGLVELARVEAADVRAVRAMAILEARLKLITSGTWFDALDLHWICLPEEVRRSAERLRDELGSGLVAGMPPEVVELGREVQRGLAEAARGLLDDAGRRRYRAEIVSAEDIARCAELLRQEGELAASEGQEGRARVCLAKAVELEPERGTAAQWA